MQNKELVGLLTPTNTFYTGEARGALPSRGYRRVRSLAATVPAVGRLGGTHCSVGLFGFRDGDVFLLHLRLDPGLVDSGGDNLLPYHRLLHWYLKGRGKKE